MVKNKTMLKLTINILVIAYVFGMLFLVSYLKKQAQLGIIDNIVANSIFDLYIFSVGCCLIYLMPFTIRQKLDKVIVLSYFLFVLFIVLAPISKYVLNSGDVVGDLLYVFSGAMLYQGITYTIKFVKIRKNKLEDNNEHLA